MKFGLSKTAVAISSPSPGHLKTQRKKLEKPKQNTGYGLSGRKNDPKRPRDPNQLAKSIIDIATGQKPDRDPTPEEQGKDPAAVSLGRKGGLKGGKARAAKLTPSQRSQAARKAAKS